MIKKFKISYDDFNSFVYAKTAKERNIKMKKINPEFDERGIDGSGMSEKEAQDILDNLHAKYGEDVLMNIGNKYWKMHSELLYKQAEYGLLSDEDAITIDDFYEFYSPLKHIQDQEGLQLDKRATGRRSKAEHMLTFSEAAIDTTFGRGETNRIKQALLNG